MDEKTVKNCTAHAWELLAEDSFGEMDYSSYGGGVEPYVIRTWVCRNCGAIRKEGTGDFNGDPSSLLEITETDRKEAEYYLRAPKRKELRKEGREEIRPQNGKRTGWILLLILAAILAFLCFVFYKAEKDTEAQRNQTESSAETMPMNTEGGNENGMAG